MPQHPISTLVLLTVRSETDWCRVFLPRRDSDGFWFPSAHERLLSAWLGIYGIPEKWGCYAGWAVFCWSGLARDPLGPSILHQTKSTRGNQIVCSAHRFPFRREDSDWPVCRHPFAAQPSPVACRRASAFSHDAHREFRLKLRFNHSKTYFHYFFKYILNRW